MERAAANTAPYADLSYGRIREIHDAAYFGRWRGSAPTDADIARAQRQLSEFIEMLVAEAGTDPPADQRDYLAKTLAAFREMQTARGSELFKAMNDAVSYGHRVLNFLLRARGEANHASRTFAQYHHFSSDGEE